MREIWKMRAHQVAGGQGVVTGAGSDLDGVLYRRQSNGIEILEAGERYRGWRRESVFHPVDDVKTAGHRNGARFGVEHRAGFGQTAGTKKRKFGNCAARSVVNETCHGLPMKA